MSSRSSIPRIPPIVPSLCSPAYYSAAHRRVRTLDVILTSAYLLLTFTFLSLGGPLLFRPVACNLESSEVLTHPRRQVALVCPLLDLIPPIPTSSHPRLSTAHSEEARQPLPAFRFPYLHDTRRAS